MCSSISRHMLTAMVLSCGLSWQCSPRSTLIGWMNGSKGRLFCCFTGSDQDSKE
jgi:hypothetical protein